MQKVNRRKLTEKSAFEVYLHDYLNSDIGQIQINLRAPVCEVKNGNELKTQDV